jgi:hypothetical protein
MATPVKLLMVFQSERGYGWSEQHYINAQSSSPNLANIINNAKANLLPARAAILGQDCQIVGVRASYAVANGIASKASSVFLVGAQGFASGSQNDSLAIVFYDVSTVRKKITHLRGFWDVVVTEESYQPTAGGQPWATYLNGYLTQLTNGTYGWLSKQPTLSPSGTVVSYAPNIDETITFNLALNTNSPPLPTGPAPFSVKFSRINNSRSTLNKAIVCVWTSATSVTTAAPIAAGPFTGKGRFSISVPAFLGYDSVGNISLGERRMGRPLGHYPGRRSRRPVL